MKKLRIFPLLLIFCLLFAAAAPSAQALDAPQLDGKAALLVDLNSGRILYELNKDEQRAPASLTKVMTVLVALEAIDRGEAALDDLVTAQEDCREGLDETSSSAGITPGTQTTLREYLYCAMVGSANEACNVIASYLAGSVTAYVDRMNQRAVQLGCVNTHFVNTNGLPAEGHYSSAYDQYLITLEAIKHPLFMEMANTLSYQPQNPQINGNETIHNSNALLSPNGVYGADYVYAYASGVKTGFTQAAGYCLISTAEKDGVNLLAVVMGCNGNLNAGLNEYRNFSDSITLYNWAFDNFEYRTVLSTAEPIERVAVELAKGDGQVILHPQQDVQLLLPKELDVGNVSTTVSVYADRLKAPIEAGTVLGEAHVLIDGVDYGTVRLVNHSAVELARGEYMRQQLKAFFSRGWVIAVILIILVLAIGYVALVSRYRRLRRKHLQERKKAEQRRQRQMEERRRAQEEAELDGEWKDLY